MTGVLVRKFGHRHSREKTVKPVKTQGEDSHPQAQERGLRRNQAWQHLDLGLSASRTVRK